MNPLRGLGKKMISVQFPKLRLSYKISSEQVNYLVTLEKWFWQRLS